MVNLLGDLFGTVDRVVRQIKFFKTTNGEIGIAFYDSQTVHGEYWIGNVMLDDATQTLFDSSAILLETKYPGTLFNIPCVVVNKDYLELESTRTDVMGRVGATLKANPGSKPTNAKGW